MWERRRGGLKTKVKEKKRREGHLRDTYCENRSLYQVWPILTILVTKVRLPVYSPTILGRAGRPIGDPYESPPPPLPFPCAQASAPGLILAHGNTGSTLNVGSPDLYISRDGGVTWSRTLQGSWGVTVADHGGLLVAAKDYHQTPSTELRYSCDEGLTWRTFTFSTTGMTVYGVLTEPGEHTTTVR